MPLIDTHCHIDLYNRPELLLQECERLNITVLGVTNLPSHFEMGLPHVKNYKRIRLALGMHPLYAEQHEKEFPAFQRNLEKTSYVGEVGLDFSREGYSTRDVQVQSFTKILKLISSKNKILSLHSRRAEKEVFELLLENSAKSAIFHWYSGPLYMVEKISSAGYYFSINPAMLKSENGRKIISKIDSNKILPETDGPFIDLSGRQIRPADVLEVYNYLSILWGKTIEEIQSLLYSNFSTLLTSLKS